MKNKNGFTLIELLAVIVILAIILAITIPSIASIIDNSRRSAFKDDAKMVLKAIEYRKLKENGFNPLEITKENMRETLDLSSNNYAQVTISIENDEPSLILIGMNKWKGLTAYGTMKNMKVVSTGAIDNIPPSITIIGNNPKNIGIGSVYNDEGATAIDDTDGEVAITSTVIKNASGQVVTSIDTSIYTTYTITYTAVDSQGNKADAIRRINVVDTISPVITLNGGAEVNIFNGSQYIDSGATATDNVDGDITSSIIATGTVNPNVVGTYTITYDVSDSSGNMALTVTRIVNVIANTITFNYTGDYQNFLVPANGYYKIELWGAQGANDADTNSSKGAYTKGSISLFKGENLYVYVGQAGDSLRTAKFNGGGNGGLQIGSKSGGGATDIRLTSGLWSDTNSLRSRIMVAAGGGGSAIGLYNSSGVGSSGGALVGINGSYYPGHGDLGQYGRGGTQTAGGAAGKNLFGATGTVNAGTFGVGGSNESVSSSIGAGGGGGGYYGGGAGGGTSSNGSGNGAGGGSSFVSGYTGCNAIDSQGNPTGQPNHYSGYVFDDPQMIAGNAVMPTINTGTETGHSGNGYAKITFLYYGTKPIITLTGGNLVTIELGGTYTDLGATAIDAEDGNLTSSIVTTGTVNPNIVGTYTITYSVSDTNGNVVASSRTVKVIPTTYNFDYTGDVQTFMTSYSGTYQFELWGASGGVTIDYPNNSKGAYVKGTIVLNSNQTMYIYVGQTGDTNRSWKFNGGGYGGLLTGSLSGGGATDVRLASGAWDNSDGLRSRIMVAAGGGGGAIGVYSNVGGGSFGGALTGFAGTYYNIHSEQGQYGRGGTQTAGGAAGTNIYGGSGTGYAGVFGKGGYSETSSSSIGAGGGGGGYYGGGPGGATGNGGCGNGGGGGSSFISGCTGCNAIDTQGNPTGQPNHYSGYIFKNMQMIAGNASMPTHDGESTMKGNTGHGYAKISYISK